MWGTSAKGDGAPSAMFVQDVNASRKGPLNQGFEVQELRSRKSDRGRRVFATSWGSAPAPRHAHTCATATSVAGSATRLYGVPSGASGAAPRLERTRES